MAKKQSSAGQVIAPAELSKYFNGQKKHSFYEESVRLYKELRRHAHGKKDDMGELIKARRPSESESIQKYRMDIYEPITKGAIAKVATTIGKVRMSPDWSVKFDAEKIPAKIAGEETLEKYLTEKFPEDWQSLEKWLFDLYLKNMLLDANAVVMVMPLRFDVDAKEYVNPFPIIFNSPQVYEYKPGELAIVESAEVMQGAYDGGSVYKGKVFYVITPVYIERYEQRGSNAEYIQAWSHAHGLGILPAFRIGGQYCDSKDKDILWETRINVMVPRLNEAAREYSDLQAEVVQHIHSEKWEFASHICVSCNGTGKIKKNSDIVACDKCKGSGVTADASPYKTRVVRATKENMGEQSVPIPPAGYIQKQVEIVKIQDERVDKHIYNALEEVNMQFVMQTPLSISGEAKQVDRAELNNFVYGNAEDLVAAYMKVAILCNEWRYSFIVPDIKARMAMLPIIPVPQKFDLLSFELLLDEVKKAKESKVNPLIVAALEVEYTTKKFYNEPAVRDELASILQLDPLLGLTEDEKMARISTGGITQEDYVISCNISKFVRRAVDEDKGFYSKPLKDKMAVMEKYAAEVIEKNKAVAVPEIEEEEEEEEEVTAAE